MALTAHQVERYWQQGFLLVSGLVPESRLRRCERRFLDIASGVVEKPPGMKLMRELMAVRGAVCPESPELAVNKAFNLEDDPALYAYSLEPALLAAVYSLIGESVYSVATNLFNKPPGVDGRHPLHQDLRYFRMRPASGMVATWTALTRMTRTNGCLSVLPGSHRGALLPHGSPDWEYVNHGFFGIPLDAPGLAVRFSERRHVEMRPGDTLFFHPLLIHGSGRNRSAAPRRAISTHYAAATCRSPAPDWRKSERARSLPSGTAYGGDPA